MKALPGAPLVAVVLFVAGCSSSSSTSQCAGGTTATLTVTVIDDTNEPINLCDATVTASGPTQVTLEPTGGQGSCSYQGTVVAGSYDVVATVTGYMMGNESIVIMSGCSVSTSIDVVPAPP